MYAGDRTPRWFHFSLMVQLSCPFQISSSIRWGSAAAPLFSTCRGDAIFLSIRYINVAVRRGSDAALFSCFADGATFLSLPDILQYTPGIGRLSFQSICRGWCNLPVLSINQFCCTPLCFISRGWCNFPVPSRYRAVYRGEIGRRSSLFNFFVGDTIFLSFQKNILLYAGDRTPTFVSLPDIVYIYRGEIGRRSSLFNLSRVMQSSCPFEKFFWGVRRGSDAALFSFSRATVLSLDSRYLAEHRGSGASLFQFVRGGATFLSSVR